MNKKEAQKKMNLIQAEWMELESIINTPEVKAHVKPTRNIKQVSLRLTDGAWKQLKIMALEENCVAHRILIEALNDLFVKRGMPPIA
jgi:hypothetical protein